MHPRLAAILVILVVSLGAGVGAAIALPDFEGAVVVRVMVGVVAFFGAFIALTKIMTLAWPPPALLAARAHAEAMAGAPERAAREAVAGIHVKMRGMLEPAGAPVQAPLTGRACLAYRITRTTHGTRRGQGSSISRGRGARARLVDASGAIEVELEGSEWVKTGDPLADAVMAQAQGALGDRARVAPELRLPARTRASLDRHGTPGRGWPEGVPAPDRQRTNEVEVRDFGSASSLAVSFEEEILPPGEPVEIVGMIHDRGGTLVLIGPPNVAMKVTVAGG